MFCQVYNRYLLTLYRKGLLAPPWGVMVTVVTSRAATTVLQLVVTGWIMNLGQACKRCQVFWFSRKAGNLD